MGWITYWVEGVQGSPTNMGYTGLFVDTKVNFPAASTGFQGSLAWASDEQKLYYCSTAPAWVAVAPGLNIAQTIGGVQTFSSIPIGPASDPTTANELSRKAFVETLAVIRLPVAASVDYTGTPPRGVTGNNNEIVFTAAGDASVIWTFMAPATGTLTIKAFIYLANWGGSLTERWYFGYKAIGAGVAAAGALANANETITFSTLAATNLLRIVTITQTVAVTANDMVSIQLGRNGSHADDTDTGVSTLVGAWATYL